MWSWLPACRVASSKWEKSGRWHFSGRYWFCNCANQDPLKSTMGYGLRIRIHCVLRVAVTASRRLVKHNGFWPDGQNPLCFSMDRELAFFPRRFWSWSQLFVFFKDLLNVWSDSLGFVRERQMYQRFCTSRKSIFIIFRFRCTSQLKWPIFKMSTTSQCFRSCLLVLWLEY